MPAEDYSINVKYDFGEKHQMEVIIGVLDMLVQRRLSFKVSPGNVSNFRVVDVSVDLKGIERHYYPIEGPEREKLRGMLDEIAGCY